MLGTREPVTPCLVAQNPPRLPPLEAALGCAWKQASPIISYKDPRKSTQASEENGSFV